MEQVINIPDKASEEIDKNPEKLNETIPIKLKIPIKEINKHIFPYLSSKIIFLLQSLIFSSVLLI